MEKALSKEYGSDNKGAIYGTLNKLGAMHGNRETPKGRAMQAKHDTDYGANDHDEDDAPKNVLKGLGKK